MRINTSPTKLLRRVKQDATNQIFAISEQQKKCGNFHELEGVGALHACDEFHLHIFRSERQQPFFGLIVSFLFLRSDPIDAFSGMDGSGMGMAQVRMLDHGDDLEGGRDLASVYFFWD